MADGAGSGGDSDHHLSGSAVIGEHRAVIDAYLAKIGRDFDACFMDLAQGKTDRFNSALAYGRAAVATALKIIEGEV